MNINLKHIALLASLSAGLPMGLHAQELHYGVKFGGGAVVGAIGPQASRATMNAAFIAEYPLGKDKEVFGEVNYRVFRSVDHEVTPIGQLAYTPTNTTGLLYAATSVDIRKDNLEGYSLSAGYRQQIAASAFWWQAGLSLNNMNSQQEVTGQLVAGVATPGAVTNANHEGLNFTPGKTSLRPGLFIGAQAKVSPSFFVEANLNGIGYQWVNYTPHAYTGQASHVETNNKFKLSLDINVGFRF
ncbi:hypothetical protein [Geothrix sp. PMB-07]|uniref:hypothetical protein n=1 Tax=Geothrix sp. PMB-07 TaxID=3068640 RepID=UPI0027412D88|nr:hypothetical protein [Geothrix sp. PMB-07]WLT31966.1 hypothetical protein Q9293_01290 [Geothrix sp. PMB-07]